MSNKIIRAAFETRLAAWAAAQTPPLPVAFENIDFTPPAAGTAYARCFLLPVDEDTETVDMQHRAYEGIFQVTLCMPLGQGNGAADDLVASLQAVFNPAAPLVQTGLRIFLTRPLSRRSGITEDTCFSVPVSCAYRADTYPT